jgi:predicted glycoside hydrolase/deacetylase ChbG (UPF0249 family)
LPVIFNADDFDATTEINQAVLLAHHKGVLTSASLMINGIACQEAIEIAQKTPTLAIGLHLVLINGQISLEPECPPHLVGRSGNLSGDALRAGINHFFSTAARRE